MAGSKTQNRNAGKRDSQRTRFLRGTDTEVQRVLYVDGKRRLRWATKGANGGFDFVNEDQTELR